MNYELAKELKDAGFPQDGDGLRYCEECPEHEIHFLDHGLVYVLAPTLSELIEACGGKFTGLTRDDDGVFAAHSRIDIYTELGATPEEAVARLWLALNKKSTQ